MIPHTAFMPPSMPQQMNIEGNEFSRNLTDRNLGDLMPTAGKGGLNIQFFYVRVLISCTNPERNGTYQNRLCVAKMPKGDRLTIATRFITEDQAATEFPREWAMFKQFQDVPTDGTPLHELPGITQSQIAMLVVYGLRSIEDLAAMQSAQVNTMGLDIITAHRLAVRWLERKIAEDGVIRSARDDVKENAEKVALERKLAGLEQSNAELTAMVRLLQAGSGAAQAAALPSLQPGGAIAVDRPDDPPEIDIDSGDFLEGGTVTEDDDPLNMRG